MLLSELGTLWWFDAITYTFNNLWTIFHGQRFAVSFSMIIFIGQGKNSVNIRLLTCFWKLRCRLFWGRLLFFYFWISSLLHSNKCFFLKTICKFTPPFRLSLFSDQWNCRIWSHLPKQLMSNFACFP